MRKFDAKFDLTTYAFFFFFPKFKYTLFLANSTEFP